MDEYLRDPEFNADAIRRVSFAAAGHIVFLSHAQAVVCLFKCVFVYFLLALQAVVSSNQGINSGVLRFSLGLSIDLYSFHTCRTIISLIYLFIFCTLSLHAHNMSVVRASACFVYCYMYESTLLFAASVGLLYCFGLLMKILNMIMVFWTAAIISYNSSPG